MTKLQALLRLLFAASLSISLAACSSSDDAVATSTGTATSTATAEMKTFATNPFILPAGQSVPSEIINRTAPNNSTYLVNPFVNKYDN